MVGTYATITRLTLASHPTATKGWGWGSTAGFGSGLSAEQVFAAQTCSCGRTRRSPPRCAEASVYAKTGGSDILGIYDLNKVV